MNGFVIEVLNMLDIQIGKKFIIMDQYNEFDGEVYYFDSNLTLRNVHTHKECDRYPFVDIIRGEYKIKKCQTHITKDEKIAVEYAKKTGHNWLCENKNGIIVAYHSKPRKNEKTGYWDCGGFLGMEIKIPISFLSWYDEDPYYIGDEKNV